MSIELSNVMILDDFQDDLTPKVFQIGGGILNWVNIKIYQVITIYLDVKP